MMRVDRTLRAAAVLLGIALLPSCGGGGDGGGGGGGNNPPPTGDAVVIDDNNVTGVAAYSFGPTETGFDFMLLLTRASLELHQALLVPQQYQCESGGPVEFRANDEDHDGALTAGDRVRIQYDCQQLSGPLTLDITSIDTDGDSILALDGAVSADLALSGGDLGGNGTMNFRATTIQLRWTGTNFAVHFTSGGDRDGIVRSRIDRTITNDNNVLRYAITTEGTIDSAEMGGTVEFDTTSAFQGVQGEWPVSGTLGADGRSNSNATFRAGTVSTDMLEYRVGSGGWSSDAWANYVTGSLFSIGDDGGGPPPPPPAGEVRGRKINLGAAGEDVVVDEARGKIYVTVPDRNELVVISTSTLAVERRVLVGSSPQSASLSLDNSELFVGLAGAGAVAIVDLDSYDVSSVNVALALETSTVYSAVETSPGILFVGGGISFGSGIRFDRATGEQTPIAGLNEAFVRMTLLPDKSRGLLYVGDGWGIFPQNVRKLDFTKPDAPVIARSDHGSIQGTHRMKLSPDGSRLYLQGGQVISTSDFSEIGRVDSAFGVPAVPDNGANVMYAYAPGDIGIFETDTFAKVDEWDSDCNIDPVWRLVASSVNGQWIMLGGETLCVIDINNPAVAPGTGDPGVPSDPVPDRNVTAVELDLGGTPWDVEFDPARNVAYVSLTSTGEILTLDPANPAIIDRDPVLSVPRGLDLSPDGSTLAIVFNANGNIGFKDLASGITERRDIFATLGTLNGSDVAWLADNKIFVSADGPGGKIVRTNRSDALDTRTVADDRYINDRTMFATTPNRDQLWVTHNGSEFYKLDTTRTSAPVDRESGRDMEILGGDRISLSPDGENIVNGFGQIIRTSDFTRAGMIDRGTPLWAKNSNDIYVTSLDETGLVFRVDPTTMLTRERIHGNCSITFPRRLIANEAENVLITTGDHSACLWYLDTPPAKVAKTTKTWTQKPYVCDTACLTRKALLPRGIMPSLPTTR